jgi:hypothetical protein
MQLNQKYKYGAVHEPVFCRPSSEHHASISLDPWLPQRRCMIALLSMRPISRIPLLHDAPAIMTCMLVPRINLYKAGLYKAILCMYTMSIVHAQLSMQYTVQAAHFFECFEHQNNYSTED